MPVEVDIDHDQCLITSVWRGVIDEATCAGYIQGVWGNLAVGFYNELIDLREVAEFQVDEAAMHRLVKRSRSVATPEARARSVFVAPEALAFGLSRMYVSFRGLEEEHQREWQVLSDYDEAVEWLNAADPGIE